MVSAVFIAEFQLMLAMNMNNIVPGANVDHTLVTLPLNAHKVVATTEIIFYFTVSSREANTVRSTLARDM